MKMLKKSADYELAKLKQPKDSLNWSIFFINFLLNTTGLFLVSFGCIFLLIYEHDYFFMRFYLKPVSFAFIITGAFLFALSIVNLLSNVYKNFIIEGANMVCLILILISLVVQASVVLAFTLNQKLISKMGSNLNSSIELFDETNPSSRHTRLVNSIQSNFKCCGLDSYKDYEHSNTLNKNYFKSYYLNNDFLLEKSQIRFNVPDSCCIVYEENCGKDFPSNSTLNMNGCLSILRAYLFNFSYTIFCICVGVILIIGLFIAYRLYVGLCFSESDYYLLNLDDLN